MTSPTFSKPYRPLPVAALNAVGRAAPRIPLSADRLLAAARRRTGLTELDGDLAVEGLRVLVGALDREAGLTPFGRVLVGRILQADLERRLRVVDAVRRSPRIGGQVITRPLFILGLPRTGTTLLFNLLAQNPRARPLLGWEAVYPLPPRRGVGRREDPRLTRFRLLLRGLDYIAPDFKRAHEVSPEGPEECVPLLNRTLVSWGYAVFFRVPSYERWLDSLDRWAFVEAYRFHRAQLQLLQAQQGGGHWLLKSPAHLLALDALVEVYPDADIVVTHRDLARVAPSTCSFAAIERGITSDRVDPILVGEDVARLAGRAITQLFEARAHVPAERIADVRYHDLMKDPIGAVRGVHDHLGLALPSDTEARMAGYLKDNPINKHGAHRYTLEQFGLSHAQVEAVAREYHDTFAIPEEN
jgi:hypothetical protein